MHIASQASGTWQFDDSNHTDFPFIYMDLASGQRDYTFTTDEGGNLILDIQRVGILDSATDTEYMDLSPVDQQSKAQYEGIFEENDATGTPYQYDKTANGIIVDPTPNYNATKGIKIAINREASYFVSTDTTKKPGVPGTLQEWFYKKPAYEYAKRKGLSNLAVLREDVQRLEERIKESFAMREKDKRHVMTPQRIKYI